MNAFQISILSALLASGLLGVFVFWRNTRRCVNQHFLSFSFVANLWLLGLWFGSLATSHAAAAVWIRITSMVGPLLLTAFNQLRLALIHPDESWLKIVYRSRRWLYLNVVFSLLCLTSFFLQDASLPGPGLTVPQPQYGLGFSIYAAYWIIGFGMLVWLSTRSMLRLGGIQRVELQFLLLGYGVGILAGVLLVFVVPIVIHTVEPAQYAPLCVTFLDGVIAYGIATRKLMNVEDVLRRATSFGLLLAYLTALYAVVWWMAEVILVPALVIHFPVAPFLAALVVAFSVAPGHTFAQRFANRLFVSVAALDVPHALQDAHRILRSIDALDALLHNFAELVTKTIGTDRLLILLSSNEHFAQRYPVPANGQGMTIAADDPIVTELTAFGAPLMTDFMDRMRPTERLRQAHAGMLARQATGAVGIHSRGRLEGIMIFGPRLFGGIYGAPEQDALQILSDQLAVALENARFYTQLQDSKLYNDILLDQLVSGVIAANAEKMITVFNKEAQRVTGLQATHVVGRRIDTLPPLLAGPMQRAYAEGKGVRDAELVLRTAATPETPIRLSTATFGKDDGILGVLLVFSDMSALKKLEMQVRRSDRLASLGTLSAGMAHEIKNPLVTLKTFTQLLPERYDDADFRNTFSSLIGQEVKRIDTIVNQLLSFAAPIRPLFSPTHVHELATNTLRLIQEQLRQKRIVLERSLNAPADLIEGDANLLGQVFVNIFLNAIDSMGPNGKLIVTTSVIPYRMTRTESKGGVRDCICVSVSDTGDGIRGEDLPRIFDPFFTTKSNGTGLGLSVAHGIVSEHGGVIDVESKPGKGTTFHIILPLQNREATA